MLLRMAKNKCKNIRNKNKEDFMTPQKKTLQLEIDEITKNKWEKYRNTLKYIGKN